MSLSKLQEIGEDRGAWGTAVHGIAKSQTPLSDWTTANISYLFLKTRRVISIPLWSFSSLLSTVSLTSPAPAVLHCSLCLDPKMFSVAFTSSSSVLQVTLYFTPPLWQTPFKSSSRAQQSTPPLWRLLLPALPPLKNWCLLSLAITSGAHSERWVMLHLGCLLMRQLPCAFSLVW